VIRWKGERSIQPESNDWVRQHVRMPIRAAVDYLQNNPTSSVRDVHFCKIDTETVTAFASQAREIFSTEG